MDQLVASNDTTPERINVKTQRKSSLVDMRRRMTNECVARVKRQRADVLSKLRCGTGQLHGPEPTQEEKLRVLQEVARDILSIVQIEHDMQNVTVAHLRGDSSKLHAYDAEMVSARETILDEEDDDSTLEDYMEMMRQIEETVMAEILELEQRQLQEYLDHERSEEEALLDAAARRDEVACPLCLKAALHKHGTTFFCQCGMRLNVFGDQLTMEQLQANVQACFDEHGATACSATPACSVQECGGYDMLIMACGACEFLNVVA